MSSWEGCQSDAADLFLILIDFEGCRYFPRRSNDGKSGLTSLGTEMSSFAERFLSLAETRSPLCLGVDPAVELLRQWGLPLDASGLRRFCDIAVEAMGDRVAVVKPQSAFFEQFGPEGMAELKRLVGMVKARGSLALIDVKRGDIGHTLDAYADAMIGPDSPFGGDAMTAVAYMGFGSLKPLLDKAAQRGAGVFIVVRSSNPEGRALQDARHLDGRTVATALADEITAFNATVTDSVGPVGAVMGATIEGTATETLASLPKSLLLAPGIGAQGATFDDMARNFGPATERALPSVSRGILAKGPDVASLRKAIEENCDLARRARDAPRG
jgi:orotidine-5'-phosphate decarboxylase